MYAHVTNGTVDSLGPPPQLVYLNGRWWDLRDRDPATLALVGWFPVVESTRPADTATTRWEAVFTPSGSTVIQSWGEIPKTPEELAAETEASNEATLITRARNALAGNGTAITQLESFAAGTTALTNTQRDNALRDLANQQARAFKQLNALIKLEVRDLAELDGT